jgi:hypothetical protein
MLLPQGEVQAGERNRSEPVLPGAEYAFPAPGTDTASALRFLRLASRSVSAQAGRIPHVVNSVCIMFQMYNS